MTLDENLFYTEIFTQDYVRKFKVEKIFFEGQTKFQYVKCFDNSLFGKILFLDKKIQSAQVDEHVYHESLVHPALIIHSSHQNILVIGGGDGGILKRDPLPGLNCYDRDIHQAAFKLPPFLKSSI